jgi:8-oxo-dGTP diphosphatase
MLYLVRHGHAGNKPTWNGPDSQRPLSPTGRRESVGLIVRLRAEPIGRILSSPALRCQQTVQPLAEQRRLAVELDQRLAVEADLEQVTGMVFNPALGDAVLCSHGELIGQLLRAAV